MDSRQSPKSQLNLRRRKRKTSALRPQKTRRTLSKIYTMIKRASVGVLVLFLLLAPYYLWTSGYILQKFDQFSLFSHRLFASLGLRVEDIIVEGRSMTSQKEILDILSVGRGDFIFFCSLSRSKKALEALPWVRSASVQRRLPDTLYIRLSEHRPIALWQNKGKMYLVDEEGKVLGDTLDYPQAGLLVLTGEGAPGKAASLLETLSCFPEISGKVTGAIFIGHRRWDILIDHKLRLKLAEFDMKGSLESFSKLSQIHKLENKEIVGIDLRFKDRVYFQLSSQALEQQKKVPGKNA